LVELADPVGVDHRGLAQERERLRGVEDVVGGAKEQRGELLPGADRAVEIGEHVAGAGLGWVSGAGGGERGDRPVDLRGAHLSGRELEDLGGPLNCPCGQVEAAREPGDR